MSKDWGYRVWHKENEEYMNGYEVLLKYEGSVISRYALVTFDTDMPVNAIIEWNTGLKDKNGTEIYEGDIVKTNSLDQPNFKLGVIEFVQQAFWISNVPSNRPDHTHSELLLQYWETEIEVIGNIHENLELLGDKE